MYSEDRFVRLLRCDTHKRELNKRAQLSMTHHLSHNWVRHCSLFFLFFFLELLTVTRISRFDVSRLCCIFLGMLNFLVGVDDFWQRKCFTWVAFISRILPSHTRLCVLIRCHPWVFLSCPNSPEISWKHLRDPCTECHRIRNDTCSSSSLDTRFSACLWFILTPCSNYGPTIAVQNEAVKRGCQQVLWLYGEQEEITEVGTMNLFIYWTNEKGGQAQSFPFHEFFCKERNYFKLTGNIQQLCDVCVCVCVCACVCRERAGDPSSGWHHSPRSHQTVSAGPGQRLGKTTREETCSFITLIVLFDCFTKGLNANSALINWIYHSPKRLAATAGD